MSSRRPAGYWQRSASDLAIVHKPEDGTLDGYIQISRRIHGLRKKLLLHRWLWEQLVGPIPDGMEIDHINGVKTDNRIENLRCVSREVNLRNKPKQVNNKSGMTGVRRNGGSWPYWQATWADPSTGKQRTKSFGITKHGENRARELAEEYRAEILKGLIKSHDYSDRHGQ